jgi:hypothetical protein
LNVNILNNKIFLKDMILDSIFATAILAIVDVTAVNANSSQIHEATNSPNQAIKFHVQHKALDY